MTLLGEVVWDVGRSCPTVAFLLVSYHHTFFFIAYYPNISLQS